MRPHCAWSPWNGVSMQEMCNVICGMLKVFLKDLP
jgi:hypothetical protein